MIPAEDVDLSNVEYQSAVFQAPHMYGWRLKVFVKMLETPVIGSLIMSKLKRVNKLNEILRCTERPEGPMYKPEFPPQETETGVVALDEDGKPEDRVQAALKCLPENDPTSSSEPKSDFSFRFWKIRDYAQAYGSKRVTPSMVAEHIISAIEDFNKKNPRAPMLIYFDAEDVRKQAAASTRRFQEGNPISVLDGIFMAIKDDIDCYPYPSKSATTWMIIQTEKDAVSVSKLRSCGVIFVGKANMHELGLGVTGNNANYGTAINPYAKDRYPGGSSSGPAAIVASGICPVALGTDGGGSVRIPSSFCGVVGLKPTFGRVDIRGYMGDSGTITVIGPIASSAEDVMLVYSVILGLSPADKNYLRPSPPCLPNLSSSESTDILGSLRLGKYTEWFNDVQSTEVSDKCNEILNLLIKTHGCKMVEIAVPELVDMRIAHMVSIGCEGQSELSADIEDGNAVKFTYDVRTLLALFETFSASDYVTAQSIRRRLMYYHMEIFKKADVIVTPTTRMTAPKIPPGALKDGETDIQLLDSIVQFTSGANFLGFPAISIPVGYDKQGLPIGLHILGRPWAEATVLRLAAAIEELCAEKRQPQTYYNVLKAN